MEVINVPPKMHLEMKYSSFKILQRRMEVVVQLPTVPVLYG